jgi:hypothetical protein
MLGLSGRSLLREARSTETLRPRFSAQRGESGPAYAVPQTKMGGTFSGQISKHLWQMNSGSRFVTLLLFRKKKRPSGQLCTYGESAPGSAAFSGEQPETLLKSQRHCNNIVGSATFRCTVPLNATCPSKLEALCARIAAAILSPLNSVSFAASRAECRRLPAAKEGEPQSVRRCARAACKQKGIRPEGRPLLLLKPPLRLVRAAPHRPSRAAQPTRRSVLTRVRDARLLLRAHQ